MLQREPVAVALSPALSDAGWGPWSLDATDATFDPAQAGPMIWLGGGLALLLWACATTLALHSI